MSEHKALIIVKAKDRGDDILGVTGWTDSKALPVTIKKGRKRYWLEYYDSGKAIYRAEG